MQRITDFLTQIFASTRKTVKYRTEKNSYLSQWIDVCRASHQSMSLPQVITVLAQTVL